MQIQFLHPFQINLSLNFKGISISGFYTIKKFWALNVQRSSTLLNKKGPKNESKGVSKMVSSYQKLATSTLSRNPKSRMETKIKISVSEGNVIVFPKQWDSWQFLNCDHSKDAKLHHNPRIPLNFPLMLASALFIFQCWLSFLVLCRPRSEVNHICFLLENLTTVLCLAFCLLHFLLTHASEAYFSQISQWRALDQASSNSSPPCMMCALAMPMTLRAMPGSRCVSAVPGVTVCNHAVSIESVCLGEARCQEV